MSDHPRGDLPNTAASGSDEPGVEDDGDVSGDDVKEASKKPKDGKGKKGAPRPDAKSKDRQPKGKMKGDSKDSDGDADAPDSANGDDELRGDDSESEPSPKPRGTDSDAPAVATEETSGALKLSDASANESAVESDDGEGDDEAATPEAGGPVELKLFGRADVGQIREHNEDNFLIADLTSKIRGIAGTAQTMKVGDGGVLLIVCDGMGGAAAGEVASQMATDVVYSQMLDKAGHLDRDQLALNVVESLEIAGAQILHEASTNRACRGMGTTATVAALVDEVLLLGQVGDSRAYILRGDRLVQVTRDQSLVNQLVEAGQLTEEEAENFEHSNIILQALGTAEAVQVDLTFVALRRGDVLMMCSDGLSGMIRDNEIAETLTNVPDPAEACRVLIDDSNEAGGHDNITVIVAVFDGEGLREATLDDVESLKYQKYAVPAWAGSPDDITRPISRFDDSQDYDSTPSIEITGEFEIDENVDWDNVLDDRPDIPKEAGLSASSVLFWLALVGVVLVLYFLLFAR